MARWQPKSDPLFDAQVALRLAVLEGDAVIAWTTIYIDRIQKHLAGSQLALTDETIRHTSPTIRGNINVYGRYDLHAVKTRKTGEFRPLRTI